MESPMPRDDAAEAEFYEHLAERGMSIDDVNHPTPKGGGF
jgi:hypothetical protein